MKINKVVLFALASLLTVACSSKKEDTTQEVKKGFELSSALQKELQLATASAEDVNSELMLTGKVTPFEERQVKAVPLVDGIIQKLSAHLGDYVQKGQTLAVISSSDVADVENQGVASRSDLLTAQKNLQVQQDLAKAGLATEKDITIAQNEVAKAQAGIRRSEEVAGIYGVKNSSYTLKAPISGYIIEKNNNITEKMAYREGDTGAFFTIADLSDVQVVANVYESDIEKIKLGSTTRITLLSYPNKVFTGKIDKINNTLDPQTRTMQVRINISNRDKFLKPEMFAQIFIDYSGGKRMVSLPSDAVIFDKNKNYIIIYKTPKDVECREIKISQTTKSRIFVFDGLSEGEKVMTKNQLMVYNALNN